MRLPLKRIKKNKDVFGKEILEVGCDIGVITCYVALLCPDSKIKGIDLCPEGIMCAKELAAKLNISNIEFECIKLQDMNTKNKYDTLLTLKTTSENMNRQGGYNQCMTLDEGGDFVKSRIEKYISELSCFVRDGGNIYSIERRSVPEFAWGYVKAMNANGLVIEPNTASRYIFTEHEDTNTAMFSFVFTKKGPVNLEDLYLLYNQSFLNEWVFKQPQYTGENAALIAQNSIRKVLLAYDVKNRYMDPIARLMVFTNDDPTAIAVYLYTINEEGENYMVVYNYDISVKEEVLADCKRTISNYKKNGFITKPIKFKPKFCKAQPFPEIIQFVPIE